LVDVVAELPVDRHLSYGCPPADGWMISADGEPAGRGDVATTDDRLEIAVSGVGDDATLLVKGEIDLGTAPLLQAELSRLADAGRRRVRVDLRDVTFMDSQGLNVLARAHRRLVAEGAALTLVAPSEPVRRVLEITGVDRIVTIAGA
jgi:anti-anti-sigma factor